MSFLSRMGVEMGNAILDAYGNLVYGDDAGKSAKLVFVARPRPITQQASSAGGGGAGQGGGAGAAEGVNSKSSHGGGAGLSSPSSSKGGGSAGSIGGAVTPPGSGASSPATTTSAGGILNGPIYDLGMTFIEVNDRAYVKTVTPDSDAAMAGVQPRDAVQFAFVHTDVRITPESTASDQDEKGAQYALDCERRGQRTSYAELCDMFPYVDISTSPTSASNKNGGLGLGGVGGFDGDSDDNSADDGMGDGGVIGNVAGGNGTTSIRRNSSQDAISQLSDMKRLVREKSIRGQMSYPEDEPRIIPRDANGDPLIYPVIMVFRRTRQRKRLVGGGMPHLFIPNFRLDDECDRAALLVQKLAPTADMAPQPDAWDELVHDGTEWLFPDGSIMPPIVKTEDGITEAIAARRAAMAADGGVTVNGGPGSGRRNGDRGPLKRVDSAEFDNLKTGEDTIPQDSWEAKSTAKISVVRQRMHEEAKLRYGTPNPGAVSGIGGVGAGGQVGMGIGLGNGSSKAGVAASAVDDVEAATIRGMIQKAVGLAFVRTSKIVLGVSIHCGSGIVIARLPDGTWSAPSAIGTWGLGLGLQFGLEVADYIFILQTDDSLAHFKAGGNFTIGGNVGAAVAGLGREAYGAASLKGSLCQGDVSAIEDEDNDDDGEVRRTVGRRDSHGQGRRGERDGLLSSLSGKDGIEHCKKSPDPSSSSSSAPSAAEVAPIVAYAKSQGLYFGVSLEGSRIFTRSDLNARAYKFTTGKSVDAHDILSGKVSTPPEAEDLYASLHSVEFAHELSFLPRPPEILRGDSPNDWRFDRSTLQAAASSDKAGGAGAGGTGDNGNSGRGPGSHGPGSRPGPPHRAGSATGGLNMHNMNPFAFFSTITGEDTEECSEFETKFKSFLYGGVSVQRLVPNAEPTGGKTRRERRTLWLMLPEVGSLRLGFISKQNDGRDGSSRHKRGKGGNGSVGGNGSGTPVSGKTSATGGGHARRNLDEYSASQGGDDYTEGGGSAYSLVTEDITEYSGYLSGDDNATQFTNDMSTVGNNVANVGKNKMDRRDAGGTRNFRSGKVHLSDKYSMALTDVTCLSQEPKVSIRFSPDDATEHLRVISIQDVRGTTLLFLANNFREAELLMCGLKLLLERETARLGVRGGVSIAHLQHNKGGHAPPPANHHGGGHGGGGISPSGGGSHFPHHHHHNTRRHTSRSRSTADFPDDADDSLFTREGSESQQSTANLYPPDKVPEGRKSWSRVPGRDYLREQASSAPRDSSIAVNVGDSVINGAEYVQGQGSARSSKNTSNQSGRLSVGSGDAANLIGEEEMPKFVFGELIIREVASKVPLNLPLPLCRALLLDSSSPVITKWEAERGDTNYTKTKWAFPPGALREQERYATEHQLIASGSMMGAYRTSSYDRLRNGQLVGLVETHIVDADDDEKLSFTVTERTPRRGFSMKIRLLLRAASKLSCEATLLGEVRPMGKNMTNKTAVHKAFGLVMNEITMRYGMNGKGLLAAFITAISETPSPPSPTRSSVVYGGGGTVISATSRTSSPKPSPQKQHNQQHQQNAVDQRQPLPTFNSSSPHRQQIPAAVRVGPATNTSIASQPRNVTDSVGGPLTNQQTQNDKNIVDNFISFEDVLKSNRPNTNVVNPRDESAPTVGQQQKENAGRLRRRTSSSSSASSMSNDESFDGPNITMSSTATTSTGDSGGIEDEEQEAIETVSNNQHQQQPLTIEVKPLPKIRLDLMPAPREEDEDNASTSTAGFTSSRHSSNTGHRKSRRKKSSSGKKSSSTKKGRRSKSRKKERSSSSSNNGSISKRR